MAKENVVQMPPPKAAPPEEAFNADDTLVYLDPPARRHLVRITSVLSLLVYAGYLIYRALYTINPAAPLFSILVYFAEVHGFFSLFFFFHEVWSLRGRRIVPPPPNLRVDVFITTYNEDVDLLRQTARAAVAMRYPHRTFLLDDGRRPAVKTLADEVGCLYLTRPDNTHAKAGNWNNAFRQTDADIIATFDADHVPRPEFLERTLGFFRDPKLALVQVPQLYHNLDSVQHRVTWKTRRMYSEQDSFFNLVMPGKEHWNAAFFCGTGAVLRRQALEPLGGIMTDTITEDLHTSVVLHSQGWKSAYLNELLVTGLAPVDLKSFEVQRLRWAEGNMKVATFINPLTAPGLSIHQRIWYFASLYHWSIGIPKFIYYMSPPWMLFSGTFPIANYNRSFLAIYLSFLFTLIASYHVASRGKGRLLMDELFNMVSFFTLTRAVKRVFFGRGRPVTFEVTAKKGSGSRDLGPILPHATILAFSVMAIVWSVMGMGFGVSDDWFGGATAIFWTLYNMTLMIIVLRIGGRPAEKRDACRFRANFAVEGHDETGDRPATLGVTADISEHGCSLLWPTLLEKGTRMPVRVHFGPVSAEWIAEIRSSQASQGDGWHRYGIAFPGLSKADVDLINDGVFNLVVPELFDTLSQPAWFIRLKQRLEATIRHRLQSRARRQVVRIPVRVHHAAGSFVGTLRDLSTSGISLSSPVPIEVGSTIQVSMYSPEHVWHGEVSVVRCLFRQSRAGFDTWRLGLRLESEADAASVEVFRRWDAAA